MSFGDHPISAFQNNARERSHEHHDENAVPPHKTANRREINRIPESEPIGTKDRQWTQEEESCQGPDHRHLHASRQPSLRAGHGHPRRQTGQSERMGKPINLPVENRQHNGERSKDDQGKHVFRFSTCWAASCRARYPPRSPTFVQRPEDGASSRRSAPIH